MNTVVANAFKLAYDGQRHDLTSEPNSTVRWTGSAASVQASQPSFHDVIQGQIEAQREQFKAESRQKEEALSQR